MTDYRPIAARLGRVRRAWKRTAALAGLAVVVIETAGMFTVALLADLLFRPGLQGRLVLLGLVLAGVGVLLVRHVLRPLFRRIPDEQIALHVEELDPAFEGALIAAAEFGREAGDPARAGIVAAILAEAERRAAHLDLKRVTSLLRLRKYARLAAVVALAYAVAGALFPATIGRHALRVAAPWRAPDRPADAAPPVAPPPLAIALSVTNADVLRGSAFRLEATLSRDPDSAVRIHFRSRAVPADEGRWHAAPMTSIEKLHAYEAVLADVNEDMECYVSAEETRSPLCRIRVYDPLAVDGIETVIRHPDYMSLPDRVSRQAGGDLAAPVGATATVRILANRPLRSGRLLWTDGPAQPLVPGAGAAGDDHTAAATFTVVTNRAYRFHIEDNMGQLFDSPVEYYLVALPDMPPSIALTRPATPPDSVTPLSELAIEAAAGDDFGLAGVDLVYRCSGENDGPEQRLPLALATNQDAAGHMIARTRFRVADARPGLRGGDVLAWHLEARDRKRQTAVTDLMLTPVRHFDIWPTESFGTAEALAAEEEPPSLAAILQSAFQLAAGRDLLAPRDLDRRTADLAQTMINPETQRVWTFARARPAMSAADVRKIGRVNALAAEGHAALAARDLDAAVDHLRHAVTLLISLGLLADPLIEHTPPPPGAFEAAAGRQTRQQLAAMAALERQIAQEARNAPREEQAEQAGESRRLQEMFARMADQQARHAAAARQIAQKADEAAARGVPPPDQAGARRQAAGAQQELAENARSAAAGIEQNRGIEEPQRRHAAEALRDAARHMDRAAREMQQNRVDKAAQAADLALRKLAATRDELKLATQDKLAQAMARAERQAGQALRRQSEIAAATAEAARQPAHADDARKRMQALAARQARLKADLDSLQEQVNTLKQAVENGAAKPETAKHIQEAERELRRGRPAWKAANAAVALAAHNPAEAREAQQQTIDSLTKAHAALRRAGDSTATGYEAELNRARHEAEQAGQQLEELQTPATRPPAADRQALAENALDTAADLARHIQSRDFVSPAAAQALHAQLPADAGSLARDKEKAGALAAAIRKVRAELDEAHARLQENKRLFSSQREECPPRYRPLVNQYFESLSRSD